jgi:serine protease Do
MKKRIPVRGFFIIFLLVFVVIASVLGGALADRIFGIKPLDYFLKREAGSSTSVTQKILREESVVVDVVEAASPSVVTVSIVTPERRVLEFSPFGGFRSRTEGGSPQDIGSGFIVSEDGLILTNKHVVNVDADYKVITNDNKEYEVIEINKDPANDIAILKINATGLKSLELGDSDNLKVGQFVIAIGTALGKFRQTVTTGVISGLGRGITAGSVFEGYVERIDDVIQTDAAINPGNSGGPLINSAGQVIGINVAVASGAENIGFAIPINIVKKGLEHYGNTGQFTTKPFLGVRYQIIARRSAILNEIPEGAYIIEVLEDTPAQIGGLEPEDIILEIDGQEISESGKDIAEVISEKSPGDEIEITYWRDGSTRKIRVRI